MNIGASFAVEEQEEDLLKNRYLTFGLGEEIYGIELDFVKEIVSLQPITEMPELPFYIKGIINLRGKIIPVMDVRLRFGKQFRVYSERTCIVLVSLSDMTVGLIVDSVEDVITITEDELSAAPETKKEGSKYIRSIAVVGTEVKLFLDCERLLNYKEIEQLESII